ncbi:MAG: large-conductance mechanosensitive channel protein MscL [Oscillibacter sp.]|nr:large-conductance mechanosensitive channel protein MscL [Oscillibacter sp.]
MAIKEKTGGFVNEFKAFIARGNVVDMAVGVIIGGSFGSISKSLVNDVVMPAVSMLTGGLNFESWKLVLKAAEYDAAGVETAAEVAMNFGLFISTIVDFLITAFAVFCVIKVINTMRAKAEAARKKEEEAPAEPETPPAPPEPSNEEKLLMEIRDLLKEKT